MGVWWGQGANCPQSIPLALLLDKVREVLVRPCGINLVKTKQAQEEDTH